MPYSTGNESESNAEFSYSFVDVVFEPMIGSDVPAIGNFFEVLGQFQIQYAAVGSSIPTKKISISI